jgi:hypothetical protein
VLQRKSPKRLAFSNFDRLVFAGLYCIAPGVVECLATTDFQIGLIEMPVGMRRRSAFAKIGRDLGSPLPDTIERNLGRFDSCLGKLDDGARYRACPRTKPRPYGSCHAEDGLQPGLTELFLGGTRIPVQA